MGWTLVAADRLGNPLGELRQAEGRGFRKSLNRGRSMRGTIRSSNSLAGNVLAGDVTLLKAYDDRTGAKVLRHHGPFTNANKGVTEAGTGKVSWISNGPEWRLLTRLIGKSLAGASYGTPSATIYRAATIAQIITELNLGSVPRAVTADDTGIRIDSASYVAVPGTLTYFGPWRWLPAASAIAQITSGLDAPEWDITPTEPTPDAAGIGIGLMTINGTGIGRVRQDAVFEFGAGRRNVKDFEFVSDSGIVANDVAHLPGGFPDNAAQAVIEQTDLASIAARGLHEDVLTDAVLTDALRTALVGDHLALRKQPRRTIQFTTVRDTDPFDTPLEERRVPRPFVDYDVGDIVPFRATELVEVFDPVQGKVTGYAETKTVDAYFRVFTIDIAINNDGSEDVTLTFVEEAS